MISSDFWRKKKVLITGHTGFKGSWLTIWLNLLGARIIGLALKPPSKPSLFVEANVDAIVQSTIGDVRNYETVLNVVKKSRPDIIIHMAAQPLVRYSYHAPRETFETNIMGTVNLFEAVRQTGGTKAIVNVTTDKCYENREWFWGYREDDPMGGVDPYSSSKGCSEILTSAFRRSFFESDGVFLASARAGNVIGGGDWADDRLVPDILKAFEGGYSAVIRNPESTRPWQHVLEPLSGYLSLAERLYTDGQAFAEAWNFGPSDEDVKTVKFIVESMIALWGSGASWNCDELDKPHEAINLKLDIGKARSRLGWKPRWSVLDALEKTISWHRTWINQGVVRRECEMQIEEHQSTK